jgi:hypothetical protein
MSFPGERQEFLPETDKYDIAPRKEIQWEDQKTY